MSHSDYQPNNREESAGIGGLTVHDSAFLIDCTAPDDQKSSFKIDDQRFEYDESSPGSVNESLVTNSSHRAALLPADDIPPVVHEPVSPLSRGLFEEFHPIRTLDVFPHCFPIQPLRDLVISYLPIADYSSPVNFKPFTEYLPGGMMSLLLTKTPTDFDRYYPALSLLTSLHDYVLFMPSPLIVRKTYGIEIDSIAMIRAIPSTCFEHLNVLYIQLNTSETFFGAALCKLQDLLTHVKILIVELEKNLPSDGTYKEFFVFDLRNVKNNLFGVLNTLVTMMAYDRTGDVNQLLAYYAVAHEQEVVLMEAVIIVDDERFPTIQHLLDHPVCRWIFRLTREAELSITELSKAHWILSTLDDSNYSIQNFDRLKCLSPSSQCFPFSGFVHDQLYNLYWRTYMKLDAFGGFAAFPNLQQLWFSAANVSIPLVLRLEDTKRLKHLHLNMLDDFQIDVGPDRVDLDVLHLAGFYGTFTHAENLFIHRLKVTGFTEPEMFHQLCRQAENVEFLFNEDILESEEWSNAFVHAKHLRCGREHEANGSHAGGYFSFFIASHAFSRLESLELDTCEVLLAPSLFPVLRKLSLEGCHVVVSSNIAEDAKDEHRMHFALLEECSLARCQLDLAGFPFESRAKFDDDDSDNIQRILCSFSAPNLQVLSYQSNVGSVGLFLDDQSCPKLSAFRWSGTRYDDLPFDTHSLIDTPLFPKLAELSLDVCSRKVKSGLLSPLLIQRLSVPSVSRLSFHHRAVICNLDALTLNCRWANLSDEMASEYGHHSSMSPICGDYNSVYEVGKWIMTRMPHAELLVIGNIYVYPQNESDLQISAILEGKERQH